MGDIGLLYTLAKIKIKLNELQKNWAISDDMEEDIREIRKDVRAAIRQLKKEIK